MATVAGMASQSWAVRWTPVFYGFSHVGSPTWLPHAGECMSFAFNFAVVRPPGPSTVSADGVMSYITAAMVSLVFCM